MIAFKFIVNGNETSENLFQFLPVLNKTIDQGINLLQMLAAFHCGEMQIVPEIHEFSIFFITFMKFGQEKS